MGKTGIIWDECYLRHETGRGHPERPERLLAIKEVIDQTSGLQRLTPRSATADEVGAVHSPDLVNQVLSLSRTAPLYFDGDTPAGTESGIAAFLAAGGLLKAVDRVKAGEIDNAFAFPRPPGHHAEADRAMGFCLFNNVAIAAQYLISRHGHKRVAVVDIDVHHGNGTQHIFYGRDDVFYASVHRYPFYPGTGGAHEKGVGVGLGFTLNAPLQESATDDDYTRAFEEIILPGLVDYRPDFLLVSAGFDAHERDPLGGMRVSQQGFEMMSRHLQKVAADFCGGRVVYALEGGYDLDGLKEGVEAVFNQTTKETKT